MEKGFFYDPFTCCSGIDCTAAFPSFPLLPLFFLTFRSSASSLDVLKGHVKYSGGIFITILSGNARGLISSSAQERKAKWIAQEGSRIYSIVNVLFFTLFDFRRDIALFLLNRTTYARSFTIRKMSFFHGVDICCRMLIECKINLDSC